MHKSSMILFVFQDIMIALMSTTMCQCLTLWFFSCWAVATIRQIILPGCLLYSPLRSLFSPPPTTKVLMTLQHEILFPVCFGSVWNIWVLQVFEGIGNILGVMFHQLLFFRVISIKILPVKPHSADVERTMGVSLFLVFVIFCVTCHRFM